MLWLAVHYPYWALQYAQYRHRQQIPEQRVNHQVQEAMNQKAPSIHIETGKSAVAHKGNLSDQPTFADTAPAGLFDTLSLTLLACNFVATQAGVRPGMSLSMAEALCCNIQLFPYDAAVSQSANDWLCLWNYNYSARVVPLQCAIANMHEKRHVMTDTVLLEVGSMAHLFGDLAHLINAYYRHANQLGFSVSLALGHSPIAAQLLAQGDVIDFDNSTGFDALKLIINNQIQKDTSHERLLSLPIALLPLSETLKASLSSMGLNTIGTLRSLPSRELGSGEMQQLQPLLAKIFVELPDPQKFYVFKPLYQQKRELLYEVEHIQGLLFPLVNMFEELALYLRSYQQAVLLVQLQLEYRDTQLPALTLDIHYPFAEHQADALMTLCRLQLERVTLYQPVISINLLASRCVALHAGEEGCLGQRQAAALKVQQLIDVLQARLGQQKIRQLVLCAQHLPEQACRNVSTVASDTLNRKAKDEPTRAKRKAKAQKKSLRHRSLNPELRGCLKGEPEEGVRHHSDMEDCGDDSPESTLFGSGSVHCEVQSNVGIKHTAHQQAPFISLLGSGHLAEHTAANDQAFNGRSHGDIPKKDPLGSYRDQEAAPEIRSQEQLESPSDRIENQALTIDDFCSDVTPFETYASDQGCRPSWLLPRPEPISAKWVHLLKGPERYVTPWWQQEDKCEGGSLGAPHGIPTPESRDYYLAHHQNGGLCWVFKDKRGLFLHGWFG